MLDSTVTIIMRTKDRSVLLARALDSVLAQTYPHWGLVVVNDGGDRDAVEALSASRRSAFRDRLLVLHNATSLGMEAATNVGLRASSGTYVVVHDDDDSWHPDFLAETVAFLKAPPGPPVRGVVTHSVLVSDAIEGDSVREIARRPHNDWLTSISLYRLCANNTFPPISFLFERSALEEIGPYREDLPVLGDWEFHLRFCARFEIGLLPKALANYHHRPLRKHDAYSNTVIGQSDRHRSYDAWLRNELLRTDLREGRLGLGVLVNEAIGEENLKYLAERESRRDWDRRFAGFKRAAARFGRRTGLRR